MDLVPAALSARADRGAQNAPAFLLAVFAACLGVSGACRARPEPTLGNSFESPEAVASAVVSGMAAGNLDALRKLAVTEAEFRDLVWPMLPASRPERNLPLEYVWNDLAAKSEANLRARLGGWQDRGFSLVSVSFKGGTEDYGTFKVHRETSLVLKDRDGRDQTGRLFGSILEYRGRFKVFSYVVD